MPLQILRWYQKGTQILPEIKDDSDALPNPLVKNVREWLKSREAEFVAALAPTDQLIQATAPTRFLVKAGTPGMERAGEHGEYALQPLAKLAGDVSTVMEFECGSCELIFKQKGKVVSRTEFLYAREVHKGLELIGPMLRYHAHNNI